MMSKLRWRIFLLILLAPGLVMCNFLSTFEESLDKSSATSQALFFKEFYYSNPPPTFQESDLAGTWEAHYSGTLDGDIDRLIIQADGTFKQIYQNHTEHKGYVFESPWNEWWVERFPDGRVRLHLDGARYYSDREIEVVERIAEEEKRYPDVERWWDYSYYDPLTDKPGDKGAELMEMVGELILNVRQNDDTGELILMHLLWRNVDGGHPFPGRELVEFHRFIASDAGSQ
ncbi:MAG: hypothetical protein QME83_19045 [Thermodesulfobacteriota bacterium]|nr:hypothetical protein [Thermodesulfobacteriota bacterium]